ncbi:MAG TPA: sulfotransferase [Acidimicrobiia bacterium]|nr:sulfotransferase [Acidimicrobiia bacterium]
MEIVGAGLGRTGTMSLKLALEQVLGSPCYHMMEVFSRPDDIAVWQSAIDGSPPDWAEFFTDYDAAVDWPVAAFWRELSDAFPDAPVLLSTRRDADAWWKSANDTIFQVSRHDADVGADELAQAHHAMANAMFTKRFTPDWRDEAAAKRAYEAHNAAVRATIEPGRLVDWQPGDGWEPICTALDIAVPDAPFPHVNTTEEFRGRFRGDDA